MVKWRFKSRKVLPIGLANFLKHILDSRFPLHHFIVNSLKFLHLWGLHTKLSSFSHHFLKSILSHLRMSVPDKAVHRLLAIQWSASNTFQSEVSFCLILFYSKTLNVKPLFAFVLALDHCRIFVRYTKTTDAILLWIINMD